MEITVSKARCLICWKGFEVPIFYEIPKDLNLYIDYKTREFRFYNWYTNYNYEIQQIIYDVLKKNNRLQEENDDTRGGTIKSIIGSLADGDFELIYYKVKCPRCKCKIYSNSLLTNRENKKIESLTFNRIVELYKNPKKFEELAKNLK